MKFQPTNLDFEQSPYTGLTRTHWISAATFLLEGMFSHLNSDRDPVVLPRAETEITYPHKASTGNQRKREEMAEIFEGLARSFFLAAPLIREDPETTVCGFSLREYYRSHVLRICTREDPVFVGFYDDLLALAGSDDRFSVFQQTVETCALVLCLDCCRTELWDTYSKEEKDQIAAFLFSYAQAGTVPQNWRLFNMLDLAFLSKEGYEIDHDIMREHAQAILDYYAGDGWYRDGQSFDYYSCWAFNVYAPIWNNWYGYQREPYLAEQFEKISNQLMETYDRLFDRDGFTMMWGRSCIYRNAATSPFDANFLLRRPSADPGLARRICSGSLLQFLGRDDFLSDGIPTMGFYRQFPPLVQGYSCAGSVYWLGKAFLCLHLPKEHPFWCAKESNGVWEKLRGNEIRETALDGPALCLTNHAANGETVLRSGKVVKNKGDDHGMWNYSKLCYNSKYPWEAAPCRDVEAQQYVLTDETRGAIEKCNITFWSGLREGVLYRRQLFDYDLSKEATWVHALSLADIAVPYGILRADKLRLYRTPVTLTLGAYGFPDNGTEVSVRTLDGAKAIVLKGTDHTGAPKQLSMTIYDGWDELSSVTGSDTNPDSPRSIVVFAKTRRTRQYGCEPFVLISQVLTRDTHEDFTDEELFPIRSVTYTDREGKGSYGPVRLTLKSGAAYTISYQGIEGKLLL